VRQARSYIVRIYRRVSPRRVIGLVEVVRTGERVSFEHADQLWAIVSRLRVGIKRQAEK
jgi:hypothetical protein